MQFADSLEKGQLFLLITKFLHRLLYKGGKKAMPVNIHVFLAAWLMIRSPGKVFTHEDRVLSTRLYNAAKQMQYSFNQLLDERVMEEKRISSVEPFLAYVRTYADAFRAFYAVGQ
jgi:hypothetical protein